MEGPRKIPEAEWNIYKERLQSLYVTENKTLEQVIEIIASDYGFRASKAQYIRKFKNWRFEKNAKSATWKGLVFEVRKRKLEGKDSEVYMKGDRVPAKKIRKEMSRYTSITGDEAFSSIPSAEDIAVQTPPAVAMQVVEYDHIPWFQFQNLVGPYFEHIRKLENMGPLSSSPVQLTNPFVQTEPRENLSWVPDLPSCFNLEQWCVDSQMDTAYSPNDSLGFSQEPLVHEDLRIVQALASTPDENCREVLLLLGKCTDAPESMDRPDSHEAIVSQLDRVFLERYEGEHAKYAERLKGRSKLEPAFQLLRFSVYLSSNNLLPAYKTDQLINWISKTGTQRVLERLLDLKSPTIEIFGRNVLISAARLGFNNIIQILIEKGVNVNGSTYLGSGPTTALEQAVSNRHLRSVQTLLDAGADPRPMSGSQNSVLHIALGRSTNVEIVRILIEKGADVNARSDDLWNPDSPILNTAACQRDIFVGQLLIAAGARVKEMSKYSLMALQSSANHGDVEFAELLIEAGADVDAPAGKAYRDACDAAVDAEDFYLLLTPIQLASGANNLELIQILLRKGADVNACPWEEHIEGMCSRASDEYRELKTALQAAVSNDNITMVYMLLMAGADVDARGYPFTALQIAARNSNIKLLGILLKEGADFNAPAGDKNGMTALQAAASGGDCELVQVLLDAGADVNAPPSEEGYTALQAASKSGRIEIAKILIRAGADVNANASSSDGRTCLQAAAENGHLDLVQLLLEKGANVNSPGAAASGGTTALQAALDCYRDRSWLESSKAREQRAGTRIFREILRAGADVNAQPSPHGGISTCEAAVATRCQEVLETIILEGLDLNATLMSDSSLVLAVIQQSTEIVSLLMKAGADVNGRRKLEGKLSGKYVTCEISCVETLTPLEAAVAVESIPLTRLLLDSGAKTDGLAGSLNFRSPLQWAIMHNSVELVKIILEAGASSNAIAKPVDCQTPLQEVVSRWSINTDILSILIEAGANPNELVGRSAQRPLRSAAARGCIEAVRGLLDAGARVEHVSEDQTTALQAAVSSRKFDLIQLLLDAGSNVNAPAGPKYGRTALQKAAELGDVSLVQYLLLHHADVNAPAGLSHGVTALQGAAIGGHLKIVLMLLKAGAQVNAPPAKVQGRFALDAAAEHGHLDTTLLLLKNDHEEEGKDLRCYRAAKFAVSRGHDIIARLLREHAASLKPMA